MRSCLGSEIDRKVKPSCTWIDTGLRNPCGVGHLLHLFNTGFIFLFYKVLFLIYRVIYVKRAFVFKTPGGCYAFIKSGVHNFPPSDIFYNFHCYVL